MSGLTFHLYADNVDALNVGIEVFKEEDKSFPAAHLRAVTYASIYHLMGRSTISTYNKL